MNGKGKELDSLWSGKSTEKVTERENSKLAKWVKEIGDDRRRPKIFKKIKKNKQKIPYSKSLEIKEGVSEICLFENTLFIPVNPNSK